MLIKLRIVFIKVKNIISIKFYVNQSMSFNFMKISTKALQSILYNPSARFSRVAVYCHVFMSIMALNRPIMSIKSLKKGRTDGS